VLSADLPEPPARPPAEALDPRDQLVVVLRELPARQRAAVTLLHWLGLGAEEVAEILGCSASTVRSQAARGIAKLRATYRAPEDDRQEAP
jgi:RNA polymerase sigma factor (sigma-70 family)